MAYVHLTILAVFVVGFPMTCAADESTVLLPKIWSEIEQEVELLRERKNDKELYPANILWEPARRIASRHKRRAIHLLFDSWWDCDKVLAQDNIRLAKKLAAYVIVEVAERETHSGLKDVFKDSERTGFRANSYGTVTFAAVDSYHDEMSQAWLLDVALKNTDKDHWMYALQLLRGYEYNPKVSERVNQVLRAKLRHPEKATPNSRHSALIRDLQSLLSSFRYATSLQDTKLRSKYHSFESRFWRARVVGPRGFIGRHMEHAVAAAMFDKQWHAGDEEFLLRIFADTASTLDELEIAVNLAYRLNKTDAPKLKVIAEGNSRQAPFASRALLKLSVPQPKNPKHGGMVPFGGFK